MFRSVRRVVVGCGSLLAVTCTTALTYRNTSLYLKSRELQTMQAALKERLDSDCIESEHIVEALEKEIEVEEQKVQGQERLWNDRFRRYDHALTLFRELGNYFPTLVRDIQDSVQLLQQASRQLKISDEYEFVSSKVHTLAALLWKDAWIHGQYYATTAKDHSYSWSETAEQELTGLLYRGDPLVQAIYATFRTQHNLLETDLLYEYADSVPNSTSMPLLTETERNFSTLNHELNSILQNIRELAPLSLNRNPAIATDDTPQHLGDLSLLGKAAETTIRNLLRLSNPLIQDQTSTSHALTTHPELSSVFQINRSQYTPTPTFTLSTLEHLAEAIQHLQLMLNGASVEREMPNEYKRTKRWIATAESVIVREMGWSGLQAFHTSLMHSLVLKP